MDGSEWLALAVALLAGGVVLVAQGVRKLRKPRGLGAWRKIERREAKGAGVLLGVDRGRAWDVEIRAMGSADEAERWARKASTPGVRVFMTVRDWEGQAVHSVWERGLRVKRKARYDYGPAGATDKRR
ncbi:hypothetical protein ABT340_09480 [Streptosporangium sp. NPDC000239]|uniref:hypothetical protein n=1 Tax=Streptosporangium sp. NPDC000239 TaxID=3154248 RepID=UPI0033196505